MREKKMYMIRTATIATSLYLLGWVLPSPVCTQVDNVSLGELGLEVEASWINSDGVQMYSSGKSDHNRVNIIMKSAIVKQGDTIQSLLRSEKIFPDAEALTVVYALNPEIQQVSSLVPGKSIMLPAVRGTEIFDMPTKLISLQTNPKTKENLRIVSASLPSLIAKTSTLPAQQFEEPEKRETLLVSLNSLSSSLQEISIVAREGSRTLNPEMLEQAAGEGRVVQEILERVVRPGGKVTNADQETVQLIQQSMDIRIAGFQGERSGDLPDRYDEVPVIVKVFQGTDRTPVPNLKVYCVPPALVSQPNHLLRFNGLTPEARRMLAESSYLIWAARDSSSQPVTAREPISVRKQIGGKEIVVELLLQP